jgi:hypothetical protein
VKIVQTAIVDLGVFNQALTRLQLLEGSVSWAKMNPILLALQQSIIPPPEDDDKGDDECVPSPTPPKNCLKKSETSTKSETLAR